MIQESGCFSERQHFDLPQGFNLENAVLNHLGIFFFLQINSGLYHRPTEVEMFLWGRKAPLEKLLMTEALH